MSVRERSVVALILLESWRMRCGKFAIIALVLLAACAAPTVGSRPSGGSDGDDDPKGDASTRQDGGATPDKPQPYDGTGPITPKPELLKAFVGGTSVALRWSERGSPGISEHKIFRDGKQVGSVKPGFHPDFPELYGNGYIDADVTPGTTYKYQVQAIGQNGAPSALSEELSVTHPATSMAPPNVVLDWSQAPDLADWMQNKMKPFLAIWYPKAAQIVARPDYTPTSTLNLRFDTSVALMATDAANAKVGMKPDWVRENEEEALGAVLHEFTHAIQNYGSGLPGWIIEGIPDWVRDAVLHDRDMLPTRPTIPMNARGQEYLNWMQTTYNPNLIHTINVKGHTGTYNESIFQQLTGKALATLIQEHDSSITRTGAIRLSGGKCIDGDLTNNRIQALPCNDSASTQRYLSATSIYGWAFLMTGDKTCIDVKHGQKEPGSPIWSYECNDGGAQRWVLTADDKLMQPQAQRCLAIAADGTSLELQDCSSPQAPTVTLP